MIKVITIYIVLTQGALSWNPTLYIVGVRRQWVDGLHPISRDIRLSDYECAIGIPYGNTEWIGKSVYFSTGEELLGPWIVTDVESSEHYPHMKDSGLAADVVCRQPEHDRYVHLKGSIVAPITKVERRH